MSSRALKKLKGESDILVPELQDKLSEEETSSATEELPVGADKKKKKPPAVQNPFDLVFTLSMAFSIRYLYL